MVVPRSSEEFLYIFFPPSFGSKQARTEAAKAAFITHRASHARDWLVRIHNTGREKKMMKELSYYGERKRRVCVLIRQAGGR